MVWRKMNTVFICFWNKGPFMFYCKKGRSLHSVLRKPAPVCLPSGLTVSFAWIVFCSAWLCFFFPFYSYFVSVAAVGMNGTSGNSQQVTGGSQRPEHSHISVLKSLFRSLPFNTISWNAWYFTTRVKTQGSKTPHAIKWSSVITSLRYFSRA